MNLGFPYGIDGRGRTGEVSDDQHVRDLLEQLLFTRVGERVNRPDFGSGLPHLVFAPNSPDLAGATQLLVQGGLQQWLSDEIVVEGVEVEADDAVLRVRVRFRRVGARDSATAEFARRVG